MTLKETCDYLKGQDKILVLCHQSPDGDTVGSGFGLYYALTGLGKTVRVECADPFPPQYSYILPDRMPEFEPECVVAVDVADVSLLGRKMAHWADRIDLCIDHHATNRGYAKRTLLCADAAAACQIMAEVIAGLGIVPSVLIADCLYTGLCTDTGCFQYSNVTPDTLRKAAEMLERGAHAHQINRKLFGIKSRAAIAMEQAVLEDLVYALDGKIAVTCVTKEMIGRTGISENEMEFIASIPRSIEGVEIGVTVKERDGGCKISVRTAETVDASKLCARFGGGGHARAAGCFISDTVENCRKILIEAAVRFCEEAGV